jgi:cytochrome b561
MGDDDMATTREHYSPFSLTLHWVTAALVLCQPLLVWLTDDLPKDEHRYWIGVHRSIGLTLLVLTLIRLVSRLSGHKAIPLPDQMPGWEKFVARANHVLFYILLIAMPLVGWAATTAAGRTVSWFGVFNLPPFPGVGLDKGLSHSLMEVHETSGLILVGLVVLHILGALKHYVINKDNVLQRMLPFLPSGPA